MTEQEKRDKIIKKLAILWTWMAVNPKYGKGLSVEDCVDALPWLDETIEALKQQDKDAEIIRKCRDGKVLKRVGDGVVVLNFEWWRKMVDNCGHFKIVPSVEDLLKAQEPRVLTLAELRALPEEPHVPLAIEERVPVGTWDGGSVVRWLDSAFVQEMYVDDGTVYTNAGTYGKLWRVWTAWPDKAMREAEPWN